MALDFELSSTQRVDLGNDLDLLQNVAGATLMAWVIPESSGTTERFIARFTTGASATAFRTGISQRAANNWRIGARRLDADAISAIDAGTVTNDALTHVCGRCNFTGQAQELFVNGVSVGTLTPSGWTANTSNTAGQRNSIGGSEVGASPYDGVIDDVRLYNRALSTAEIQNIYNARGRDRIVNGLVARYVMNEDSTGDAATAASSIINKAQRYANGSPTNSPVYANALAYWRRRRR